MSKKILLVTRNFPPLIGGMEKLNLNIFNVLSSRFDVSMAGPHGSPAFHNASSYVEFPPQPLWKYVLISLFKTIFLSTKVKPDIVFCGSGAAIVAGYFAARFTKARLVCYLHGLDIIANNFVYQKFFVPLIKKSDLIVVNSRHTKTLAIEYGLNVEKIKVLSPGVDMPDMLHKALSEEKFRNQYNLQQNPFILIAGRITRRKGIVEFIENVMPELAVKHPQLKLVIIGDEATQAIACQSGLREEINCRISSLGLDDRICMLGGVNDETFSSALFSADMLIFPVLDIPNDVEGFGMVAIEAAAHGTPTLGFAVGGVPDAIGLGKSGWLVSPGEYQEMKNIILNYTIGCANNGVSSKSCISFAQELEWHKFGVKLEKILMGIN